MESKSACGFIKYDLPTTTTVPTQSTAIVTRTIDHNLEIIGREIEELINNRCNGTNGTNLVEALTKLKVTHPISIETKGILFLFRTHSLSSTR